MGAPTENAIAAYPHSNAWHLIGALLLAVLLAVLPLFGIGPTTWSDRPAAADMRPLAKSSAPALLSLNVHASPPAVAASSVPPAPEPAAIAVPSPEASASASAEPMPAPSPAPSPAAAAPAPLPRADIYFELEDDDPPADARQRLAPIVAYLKAEPDAKVRISGYHEASGNRAYNQDLAARREVAVRGALERAGIRRDRIIITQPVETASSGKAQQARRTAVTIVR